MGTVAIYGGAFDPPHIAHVFAVSYLLTRHDVDEVWLVPNGQHAFGKTMAPFTQRVQMLQAVCRNQGWGDRVSICCIEGEPDGPSYTFDTLNRLSARHAGHQFVLVIGADNLSAANRWHRFEDITSCWPVIVLGRPGYVDAIKRYEKEAWCKPGPTLPDVSSTAIRESFKQGTPSPWLPECILPLAEHAYDSFSGQPNANIQVFGYGRAGGALTLGMRREGLHVRTWNRSAADGVDEFGELPADIKAATWLLCVDDTFLSDFATMLAHRYGPELKNVVVLHCAGRLDASVLSPLEAQGAFTGSMHPCLSLESHIAVPRGGWFGVDGHPVAAARARGLVETLGGQTVSLPDGSKSVYHAAAVLAGNFMTTLTHDSIGLLEGLGISESSARAVLTALQQSTLDRIKAAPPIAALTGPMARKDLKAIEKHVVALSGKPSSTLELYKELARHTARMMDWSPEERQQLQVILTSDKQPD